MLAALTGGLQWTDSKASFTNKSRKISKNINSSMNSVRERPSQYMHQPNQAERDKRRNEGKQKVTKTISRQQSAVYSQLSSLPAEVSSP